MSIQRWKRAVINLEGATDENEVHKRARTMTILLAHARASMESGCNMGFSSSDEAELLSLRDRQERHTGTAIYLADQGKRYLLTARHVLHDPWAEKRAIDNANERANSLGFEVTGTAYCNYLRRQVEYSLNEPFRVIFLVPRFDDTSKFHGRPDTFLMNLPEQAYTFSTPQEDLAVISLDTAHIRFGRFADTLDALGYLPIALDDIADGPSDEGAEVFTVGYPGMSAVELDIPSDRGYWQSRLISEPAFSFGRISMLHTDLPSFWADISIAPGNSGGPLVEDNRLVGNIQRQATEGTINDTILAQEVATSVNSYMPFASVMKAGSIKPLISAQQEKDWLNRHRIIGPPKT